ncbi:MAG TPA: hypothetical protein VKQ09_10575 [Sphingomonas sp.]|nr:hypothetical protein [Sphingomonas sp.]
MTHPISGRRSSTRPARLAHAITATGIGGAQSMLAKLLGVRSGVPTLQAALRLLRLSRAGA